MDFVILSYSFIIMLIGLIGLITFRYHRGEWQWNVLYPGKYIFPKRIKRQVRASVLAIYKAQTSATLSVLENKIEEVLNKEKLHRINFSYYSINARYHHFSEFNFKYFLFLRQASFMVNPSPCMNGVQAEAHQAKRDMLLINAKFSELYIRKAISTNDRSIILAEILYRTMLNLDTGPMPYGHEAYLAIRETSRVEMHEGLITKVMALNELESLILNSTISNSCVYDKASLTTQHAILFRIYLLLLTKWQ